MTGTINANDRDTFLGPHAHGALRIADISNPFINRGQNSFAVKQGISLRVEEKMDLGTISIVFMTVISGHPYLRSPQFCSLLYSIALSLHGLSLRSIYRAFLLP